MRSEVEHQYNGGNLSEGSDRAVVNVDWSVSNLAKYGSPVLQSEEMNLRYFLYPSLRAQFGTTVLFFLAGVLTISASNWVPWTVISGKLFSVGGYTILLRLPLLIFLPGFILSKIFIRLYDSEYIMDSRGVEAHVGQVSFMLRQPRLRFEDIRGVEPNQTIWERMLGAGNLEIGSAMKEDVEIVMEGIVNPRAVQLFIGSEIENSIRRIAQGGQLVGSQSSALVGE